MQQITKLFQPVKFKRNKKSSWECGIKQIDNTGIIIFDSNKNIVEKTYKIEGCWI